jgi:lipid II:glycine glycyltransferase (peptidoglycan interpeptide bridge formation enzyme)
MAKFLEPRRGLCFVGLCSTAEDVLPFRWRDFKCVVEYTYRLPLIEQGEGLLRVYDSAKRRNIRKGRHDGLETEVGLDLDAVGKLQEEALMRDGAAGAKSLHSILRYASRSASAFTVTARRSGEILAGCLVVGFRETAYYILGGHSPDEDAASHRGAGSLTLHTAIVEAAQRGFRIFDFEGSTIPRVEPFIRGFGGTLVPYYSVAKAWFPIECALKIRYRSYF